ncbi:MAG: class I SAM-dependent methyltransferase [Chloroflexi bacterium]|nr:class I SAM-dependent methyltransferase [Chloroflexota bacterium]
MKSTIATNFHVDMLAHLNRTVDVKGRRVLDIGGAGSVSRDLARAGAAVCLIDFSGVATRAARNLASEVAFDVVQGDARELPFFSESFDIVLHQGFLEHFVKPANLLQEQHRVLRTGGFLLVDAPQRFNWYAVEKRIEMKRGTWPYGWETDFTYHGLCRLLRDTGFVPIYAYGRGYHPPIIRALRNLRRIEKRIGHQVLPSRIWDCYDALWSHFETGAGGWYSLVNLGVIAKKLT